jgi:pyruvate,water dikinase
MNSETLISQQTTADLATANGLGETRYIASGERGDRGELGGKAAALARLAASGLDVPAWFVVTPAAFAASLRIEQAEALARAEDGARAQAALAEMQMAPEVRRQLAAALAELAHGAAVAVRSSAVDEDGRAHSFAGQLESFLNVTPERVEAAVIAVWRSGFGARVFAYRREHGLALPPPPPAVLIQRMVQADAAGVAFSADPVSGRRSIAVAAAVRGLGDTLVSGAANADTFRVDLDGQIVERIEQEPGKPMLDDEQARRVAALARQAARWFGRPQDVEWAIEKDNLYLLQSRPITALAALPDPDGVYTLWDNSNIIESYGGMTTPLTYAFARRAYTEVYQEFCRILRVREATIQANRHVFACMIGLIRGRIYYNLLNWYRVLAMLPGYKTNRHFMEQMMGVKESLPEELVAAAEQSTLGARLADRLALLNAVAGLATEYFRLEGRKQAFYRRLTDALGEGRPDLSRLRADELAADYRRIEGQLLHKWDAPLINDFFAMIFYGVLRRLAARWIGDAGDAFANDLLVGEGGMISAEPAARVRELARLADSAERMQPGFVELLRHGSRRAIEQMMAGAPAFAAAYQAYLDKFGERCMNELKLESATLIDDPLPLLRAVGQLAGRPQLPPVDEGAVRRGAEERVQTKLAHRAWRRWLFGWTLRNARARVRDRENLRFERTRIFGRARQIFRELGRHLAAAGRLDAPEDVFYLELDEIFGFVDGTTTCTDLAALAAVRKQEFAHFATLPAPVSRFVTYGMVHEGNTFAASEAASSAPLTGESIQGLGCCPGIVEGPVRVVTNPLEATLQPGEILAAEHTDPSWIMIMPLAAGMLVERGSLLSHTAIVSRELGIPAIVGLTGITTWLRDGERVVMDGSTGRVRKVEQNS